MNAAYLLRTVGWLAMLGLAVLIVGVLIEQIKGQVSNV